jgi:hypothetical protein
MATAGTETFNLAIDKYGNPYRYPVVVSEVPHAHGRWEFIIGEAAPPVKRTGTDRLVTFDVQNVTEDGRRTPIWRKYDSYTTRAVPYPNFGGCLALATDGQLAALISDHQYQYLYLKLYKFGPSGIALPPQPRFNTLGLVNVEHPALPAPIYKDIFRLPPDLDGFTGISLVRVSNTGLIAIIRTSSDEDETLPSYPDAPRRMHLDFRTKKWTVVPPDKAEVAKRTKARQHKWDMAEYRFQRETMARTKEGATEYMRARLKDPNWNPDPEPWDTPDLKQNPPWAQATPAATATPTPKPPVQAP